MPSFQRFPGPLPGPKGEPPAVCSCRPPNEKPRAPEAGTRGGESGGIWMVATSEPLETVRCLTGPGLQSRAGQ
jgi:hypothetical protein